MNVRQSSTRKKGTALQWTIASIAMLLVGVLVVFLMNNRPAPPHFSELTIDTGQSPSLRRGARMVLSSGGVQRTFAVTSAEFTITEGGTLHPDVPSGPFSARYSIPFELDEALEATLFAEFDGCQVQIKHGETLLAASDGELGLGVIDTGQLPFPAGTTDIIVDIKTEGDNPSFRAWWVRDAELGEEIFPVFKR